MWVRKRLDIGWSDLAVGLICCGLPARRRELQHRLERTWSESNDALACLSVRSGFDLLLECLGWPAGSEILMSAMTIPDMARVVQHHGLVPVPVDLEPDTLGPNLESLRRAITPRSRAILVAHLCGGRVTMEPILRLARQQGLLVFEDCAQAFDGREYTGHPDADVSMFSFGPIKTATALGGAILRVRDRGLLERMRARQADCPVQHRRSYLCRLLKYAAFKALSARPIYGLLVRVWLGLGRDYDRLVNGSVRGFPGPEFFRRIRQQPSAPLLAVLRRRVARYDHRRLARRAAKGRFLVRVLADRLVCAGAALDSHNFWVFPVLADRPTDVIAALRGVGFDATQGHSMCVVPPPPDRPELAAAKAAEILAKIVYLPIYPEMPDKALRRMAEAVLQTAAVPTPPTQPASTPPPAEPWTPPAPHFG